MDFYYFYTHDLTLLNKQEAVRSSKLQQIVHFELFLICKYYHDIYLLYYPKFRALIQTLQSNVRKS